MANVLLPRSYCTVASQEDIEEVAITLYHAAVAAGQETADNTTVDKDKYRALALALIPMAKIKRAGLADGSFICSIVKGSSPPPPVVHRTPYTQYSQIPSLDPTK